MYKRLLILSVIVLATLFGVTCLGYHAVNKWAQGLEGARLGEFAEVAEQIRQDVKRKLDEFIQAEQERPYTDYQQYYVPDTVTTVQQQLPLLRSPLAGQLANGFAYGYFQIEPSGDIVAPWYSPDTARPVEEAFEREAKVQFDNIVSNFMPAMAAAGGALLSERPNADKEIFADAEGQVVFAEREEAAEKPEPQLFSKQVSGRKKSYSIESLQAESVAPKVLTQQRAIVASNRAQPARSNEAQQQSRSELRRDRRVSQPAPAPTADTSAATRQRAVAQPQAPQQVQMDTNSQQQLSQAAGVPSDYFRFQEANREEEPNLSDTVQIRIEPFVPMVVPEPNGTHSLFGRQVFLLRRVQVEDEHIVQGFQFNEEQLVAEVKESAERFARENMGFDLCSRRGAGGASTAAGNVAYTAILDFGFGELLLYLKELDPAWIGRETGTLRRWYLSTIAVVFVAVSLALAGLWKTTRAQIKLAQKKDEFISAVSHELRTPLTSIRMYAEMLENNWLTSKAKTGEYYRNIRQESERLSRLIENVLDFSRLQRGRKRYDFRLGDVNQCIAEVVAMMRPYAAEQGFAIETDFGDVGESTFDRDAVAQIVVNLLDNAVKYARSADDKRIHVRTTRDDGHAIIEVEDHGPGVPNRQRTKIFEQFYRGASEAPGYQTTGTGLGLALVKRFAEAHRGFVEIRSGEPGRTIFCVGLAIEL